MNAPAPAGVRLRRGPIDAMTTYEDRRTAGRTPASAGHAHRARALADAFGDLAAELGLRDHGAAIGADFDQLVVPAVQRFLRHGNWPTRIMAHGTPIEFSISTSPGRPASVRFALDTMDYRKPLARNYQDYVDAAVALVGADAAGAARLRELTARHLAGCPADPRARVTHGVGYQPDLRRVTLYFSANWLTRDGFAARCPESAEVLGALCRRRGIPVPDEVGLVGHDLDGAGSIRRTKIYVWLERPAGTGSLDELVGAEPQLRAANLLYERFSARGTAADLRRSMLWSIGYTPGHRPTSEKIGFACPLWGWHLPDTFAEVLAFLAGELGQHVLQLEPVFGVFAEHRVRLRPTFVTAGPDRDFACYFVPVLDEVSDLLRPGAVRSTAAGGESGPVAERRRIVGAALEAAAGHVLDRRAPDGGWTSPAEGPGSSEIDERWRTAFVASVLAAAPLPGAAMEPTLRWLRAAAADPAPPAGRDEEVMALAAAALAARDRPDPAILAALRAFATRAPQATQTTQASTEALAAALTALVAASDFEAYDPAAGEPLADELLRRQRADGGWAAERWTDALATTADAARALSLYAARLPGSARRAPRLAAAQTPARTFVRTRATYDEPFLLGSWLSAWVATGASPRHPTIDRILKKLVDRQRPDGRWPSTPARHLITPELAGGGRSPRLYLDGDDIVVTALVIRGLSDVLRGPVRRE